jgi:hypothetical protein
MTMRSFRSTSTLLLLCLGVTTSSQAQYATDALDSLLVKGRYVQIFGYRPGVHPGSLVASCGGAMELKGLPPGVSYPSANPEPFILPQETVAKAAFSPTF